MALLWFLVVFGAVLTVWRLIVHDRRSKKD